MMENDKQRARLFGARSAAIAVVFLAALVMSACTTSSRYEWVPAPLPGRAQLSPEGARTRGLVIPEIQTVLVQGAIISPYTEETLA
jgi:hypothetical protein